MLTSSMAGFHHIDCKHYSISKCVGVDILYSTNAAGKEACFNNCMGLNLMNIQHISDMPL